MLKRSLFTHAPMVGAVILVAACGGNDNQQTRTGDATPATTAPTAQAPAAASPTAATGEVIEVRMVTTQGGASGEFQPAQINAKQGDVIRIINDGGTVHNMAFPAGKNPAGANLPPSSPFLTGAGETADIPVTMGPGSYHFDCTPHAMMGMVGTLTVN